MTTMRFFLTTPIRLVPLALIVILATGCGDDDSPTAPPSVVQVGGIWTGTVTQVSASGGPECLGLFQQSNGLTDNYTVSITQNGSSLTATASSQTGGETCNYTGTAGSNSVALNATSCNPSGYQATCNFQPRDIAIQTRSVTGTVSGNTMTGTTGETWNVMPRGSSTGLGTVAVANSFSLRK